MRIWIVQDGEPIPGIDEDARDWRTTMFAKALIANGHEVLWWASTFDHARKRNRFPSSRTVDLQPGLQVRLLHGPGYGHNKSPKRFWHHRILAKNYAHEAASRPAPDLVFCSVPTLELAEQSVLYGRRLRIPVLVDVRDAWPDLYLNLFPSALRKFARILLMSEVRRAEYIFGSATGIIGISDTYLNWALRYARRSSISVDGVFPIGYSLDLPKLENEDKGEVQRLRAKLGVQPSSLVVTFIGTFGASYDLETVIRAASVLSCAKSSADIKIVVAGNGDKEVELFNMSEGVPSITFTGWLQKTEIAQLMSISSIGLAAYARDALQSLPNKPFEYMAAGLPLLSSLPGELEQLISEHRIGLNYVAGDVQSLVDKIKWLYENEGERIAMGQRANRLFEERFRGDIIYPKLVAHLEQVAERVAATISLKSLV